ncbi:MAG: anaerobic ribonucleoside-triphosphate reductase [Christensenellales bacterium]
MACAIHVEGGELSQTELSAYLERAREKFGREPRSISIKVDGDFVDMAYDFDAQPFQRIRRITGYLVGTLDRFNNGKRAEEHDRVKHSLSCGS